MKKKMTNQPVIKLVLRLFRATWNNATLYTSARDESQSKKVDRLAPINGRSRIGLCRRYKILG